MNSEKKFFIGGKDLEMVNIVEVLTKNNQPFVDEGLGWGAKASAYARKISEAATEGFTPVLVELEVDIDLPRGTIIVDHHNERAGEPASILQVLDLLELEPSRWQRLVAANDSGYIPAMLALEATEAEIAQVRLEDREAQGITPEQEAEAERAISAADTIGRLMVVRMSHSKTSPVADRLFGKSDQLLILSGDGEANFYGNGALCSELKAKFEGWSGGAGLGDPKGNGFWGGYPNHDELLKFIVDWLSSQS